MKRIFHIIIPVSILAIIFGCMGLYYGLQSYYNDTFCPNSWINGIYCTGMSIEEINEELINKTKLENLVIRDVEENTLIIDPKEIDMRVDYRKSLVALKGEQQKPFLLNGGAEPSVYQISQATYSWDEEKLAQLFQQSPLANAELQKEYGCRVRYGVDGFYLYDGNRQRLNMDACLIYLKECLAKGQVRIQLAPESCYENLPDNDFDRTQKKLWKKLQQYISDHTFVYDMGTEKIEIGNQIISSFLWDEAGQRIRLDQNGKPMIDSETALAWLDELVCQYDTVDTTRSFQTTRGDRIDIDYVTYGTKLDLKAEQEFLIEQLQAEEITPMNRVHIPSYIKQGFTRGIDDLGGTYIEVDMTMQHMYYYVDGDLVLETDVVTGNIGRRMGTPVGINAVYRKQKNRILRGDNYATPVKYWVPVKGNVGIHDASWRSEFGGEIYKTNGSHGCINTPTEVMATLYELVEVGTPVVMFY